MPPSAVSIAHGLLGRAGERALLIAEQLALEQLLRNRRAIDRDEAARYLRCFGVNGARDQLFPVPLAEDQHGNTNG